MLLLTMMGGLYDQRIRNKLLYHSADMDLDAAIAFIEEREGDPSSSTESSAGGLPSAPPRTPPSQDSSGGVYSTVREYQAGELLSAVAYDESGGVSADKLVD